MPGLVRARLVPLLSQDYADRVRTIAPGNLIGYWPLWEQNGAAAFDQSGNGRNGIYTGVGLGQAGIGDGRSAPSFDAATSGVALNQTGLSSAFNGAEGGLMIWAKVRAASVWSDGAIRRLAHVQVNASNIVGLFKRTTANLQWRYYAGGTAKDYLPAYSGTDWFQVALTWSKSGDLSVCYLNGAQQTTFTGLGVWAGTIDGSSPTLGAFGVGNNVWDGWLAHCAIWNTALTSAQIADLARVN